MRETKFVPMPDCFPDFVRDLVAFNAVATPAEHRELNAMLAEEEAREEAAKRDSEKPKRQRKPSVGTLIKQAERCGRFVTSVTTPDGTTLHFADTEHADAVREWDEAILRAKRQ
jgi:hypothetical protein